MATSRRKRDDGVAMDTGANSDGSSGVCILTMARGRRGCGGSCSWMQSIVGECSPGMVVAAGRAEKTMQSRTTGAAAVTGFSWVSASWWLRSGVSNGGRTGSWRP